MSEEKSSYFVGLDVGTTAVRCVVGELRGEASLPTIIAATSSPSSGMRKGNVANIDEVATAISAAIGEAERTSGRNISSATVNINGSHVQSIGSHGVVAISSPDREISVDDRERVEEAATIVQLPANKSIIQVFAKNYRLDGQDNIKNPVGMHGVRLEVDTNIIMAADPSLRPLDEALEKAGVFASHHTVTGLAAAEAVLTKKQKEFGVLVLDIGAATTNIAIIEDSEIEHVAVIPMGGIHITNDLAIGLKTDLDVAEMIKNKYASLDEKQAHGSVGIVVNGERLQFERGLIREVASARVEELLELVDKELKRVHKSGKLPGGVVLVGGSARLPGLVEVVKKELGLPARTGSLSHIEKVVDKIDELTFAPAVGLMLLNMYLGPAEQTGHAHDMGQSAKSFVEPLTGILKQIKKLRP